MDVNLDRRVILDAIHPDSVPLDLTYPTVQAVEKFSLPLATIVLCFLLQNLSSQAVSETVQAHLDSLKISEQPTP